jgi:restriction endonuclease Mrr
MALKRKMTSGDPEELWRAIRTALIADARLRATHGLRPRVRHVGGALFAVPRLEDEVRAREEALAQRIDELAATTLAALQRRLVRLPHAALEQVVRLYLDRSGYDDVERVKRSDETWYLSATTRRGASPRRVLIGVRAGGNEIGRKAVGELRAGVSAKQLDEGILYAAARLGAEGERELAGNGAPVTVYDGEAFARELLQAGVGVQRTAVTIAYLDADFFADLTEA